MITFKTFLKESSLMDLDELTPEQLKWVKIFVEESDSRPLLRGVKGLSSYPVLVNGPTNRRPRDTNRKIHAVFDDLLLHEVKFRGRSEAFFTTGALHIAGAYGPVYYIIPCTKYKYAWFARHDGTACKDSVDIAEQAYNTLHEMAQERAGHIDELLKDADTVWTALEQAIKDLNLELVNSEELAKAIQKEAEIMLYCDQAILIPAIENYKQVLEYFK
jgi:hypothetical protein